MPSEIKNVVRNVVRLIFFRLLYFLNGDLYEEIFLKIVFLEYGCQISYVLVVKKILKIKTFNYL